ncbi:MAG: UTP--glucose-1-phosphate uridylyltransferase [Thermoplasmata archaeon]
MKVRKAVIPAAGIGKRFYPLTRAQPKEMLPILDKPVIHYVVEEALRSSLDEILIITGYGKDAIINYFDRHELDGKTNESYGIDDFPEIYFVRQKEQKGLADALKYAEKFVGQDPFVVLLGDTIYVSNKESTVTSQLINLYSKKGSSCITVEKVEKKKIHDYGIISGNEMEKGLYKIDYIVEKPDLEEAPSNLGITGIYLLNADMFEYIKQIKPGKNGEYQLADAFNLYLKDHEMLALEMEGKRYDVGTKELWVKTFIEFARNDLRFKDLV